MIGSGPSQGGTRFDDSSQTGVAHETEMGPALSKEEIIDGHNLTFDPGDKLNGSLYLTEPFNTHSGICREKIISAMRNAQLWSDADPKQVADGQRQAYKDQLELVDAIRYQTDQGQFSIARFDHAKFLSDDGRWSDWQKFFDARYARVDSTT